VSYHPERIPQLADDIRAHVLRMVHRARASHVGSCFSMADILAVLYGAVLRVNPLQPQWQDRDRFLLSKGHGAAAVYAVLAECGFFPKSWLETYSADGTKLSGHVSHYGVPGVDHSTGSLGHGLSVAAGMALAGKRNRRNFRTFCLLSDGECDEGSVWEAVLFAPQHDLDNLIAIVDYNKIQSFGRVEDVLDLEPFADKWRSFGWDVREVDGHDHFGLYELFCQLPLTPGRPTAVIAHTIKGKGVSFMQDRLEWHYKSPNSEQLSAALGELRRGA
jgi:transketolase